jgi:hypothetical protein
MCAAALLAGLTACTKEEFITDGTNNGGGNEVEGVSTYATFNFVINGATTRATNMIDDGSEIDKVKDIRLIIFKTGASTACEVNEIYNSNATDWDEKKSKTVQLTSGTKRIFVITNTESQANLIKCLDTTSIVVGKTSLSQFYDIMYDLGATNQNKLANIDKLSGLVDKTNGYVMSNTISSKSSFVLRGGVGLDESRKGKAQENNFDIEIQRTVAKASVYYGSASVLETMDKTGTLTDLNFTFQNVNRSLYMFQKFASDAVDPSASTPRSPYYSLPVATTVATYDTTYYSDYNFIKMGEKVDKNFYVTENTSETPRNATTTYAAIKSVFLPKKGMVVESFVFNNLLNSFTTVTTSTADATAAKTLYRLVDVGTSTGIAANVFFTDSVIAYKAAYCIDKKTDVGFDIKNVSGLRWDGSKGYIVSYPGGVSYHRLNIGENNAPNFIPGIKRNHVYNAKITSFSGIGVPDVKDLNKDPDKPIGQKTHVTATISVVKWVSVNTNHEL